MQTSPPHTREKEKKKGQMMGGESTVDAGIARWGCLFLFVVVSAIFKYNIQYSTLLCSRRVCVCVCVCM